MISAVNVVIIDDKRRVLIAKRSSDRPMPDKWEFPGGKLEQDEGLESCGIREIKEELELDVLIGTYLGCEELEYEGKMYCIHFYTATLADQNQAICLHAHTQAQWVRYDALDHYDLPARRFESVKKLEVILA